MPRRTHYDRLTKSQRQRRGRFLQSKKDKSGQHPRILSSQSR